MSRILMETGHVRVYRLVTSRLAGDWCRLPYPNHPRGCPNYFKRETCPPLAPFVHDVVDHAELMFLAFSAFDLEAHAEEMGRRHPHWTERQRRNVLYWQGSNRRRLREEAERVSKTFDLDFYTACPEGMGVNVYATARNVGLELQRIRDLKVCYHIALIGRNRRRKR